MEKWQAVLTEAVSDLLAAEEPLDVLPKVYERLSEVTGLEMFLHFEYVDPSSPRLLACVGLVPEERTRVERIDLSKTVFASVAARGVPIVLFHVDRSEDPRTRPFRELGLRAFAGHPLVDRGRTLGILSFGTRKTAEIPPDTLSWIQALGNVVATTLARHREDLERKRSEDRYRRLFDSIDDGVCVLQMIFDDDDRPVDYRFLEINPMFERHTGLTAPAGKSARELVPDLDESWFRVYGQVALTGESIRFENPAPAMDRAFEVNAIRVGRPEDRQVALVFKDISERKRRERDTLFVAELHQDLASLSDRHAIANRVCEKLEAHLDLSRVVLADIDDVDTGLTVVPQLPSVGAKYTPLELLVELLLPPASNAFEGGAPFVVDDVATDPRIASSAGTFAAMGIGAYAIVPHFAAARLRSTLAAIRSDARPFRPDEIELLREVSTLLWIRLERAEAEADIRDSEEHFRTMADTAPVMLWITNAQNFCTFLSRGWYDYTGQTEEEGLGAGWLDAVHPDDRERVEQVSEAGPEPFSIDYRLRGRDGSYRWCIDAARPQFDAKGRFIGHIGSVIDVHDRKVAEEALREADRRKDHFMAVLSHELRNPLAPIQNGLDVLDSVAPDSEQARRIRAILRRQVAQLRRLVDDLLDVTRITRNKVALRRERLELNDLVRHTVDDHRSLFDDKGVTLSVRLTETPLHIRGDRNRLTQAIGNLLQNAAKFTPAGKRTSVEVESDSARGLALVRVIDTGIGIEATDISTLFEPFMQADSSLARRTGGLGLGLALVRGLAELHGGDVRVASEGLGRGAEFVLSLPLDRVTADDPGVVEPKALPERRRVLIIEDTADVAQTLRAVLELEGHDVEVAVDGREGLRKARIFHPSVVLCDIGLPGMDGYAVARAMRDDPELRSTVRIAVSGYAMPEDVRKSTEAGFQAHFAKPLTLDALRSVLAGTPAKPVGNPA